MLEPGESFEIVYRGNKTLTCKCLAGRQFSRLMSTLSRLQKQGEDVDVDLFDKGIPEALSICIGDEQRASEMWDSEITLRDAIEILSKAVQGHVVTDDIAKK